MPNSSHKIGLKSSRFEKIPSIFNVIIISQHVILWFNYTNRKNSKTNHADGQANRSVQTNATRSAANNNGNAEHNAGGITQPPAQNPAPLPVNQENINRRRSTLHQAKSSRKKSTDRTTRLLIVILVLFLLTEFPQVNLRFLIKVQLSLVNG